MMQSGSEEVLWCNADPVTSDSFAHRKLDCMGCFNGFSCECRSCHGQSTTLSYLAQINRHMCFVTDQTTR